MTDPNNLPPAAPAYNAAPAPAAPGASFPGKTLGIVSIPVAIFFNLIGLILGIVALVQSRKAGYKNGPAVAGIIIGAVLIVVGIIVVIVVGATVASVASQAIEACRAVDFQGTVVVNGAEITCTNSMR